MLTTTVVIAIFLQNKKILVEKRELKEFDTAQYLFPGGEVENNENIEDALRREVLEELGITINNFYQLPCTQKILGLKKQHLIPFIVTSWEGRFPSQILDSGTPIFWIDTKIVCKSKVNPTRMIIQELENHLS